MKKVFLARKASVYVLSLLLALGSFSNVALAQVQTTARISGTVVDQQGAVISNAQVVIKDDATGQEFKVNAGDDGLFVVPSLGVATYTVTVTAQGFKQTVVKNVRTEAGQTASVRIVMEVGATNETVTVTSGAEVLQKESTNVGATITGRQITELPFTSRDALDLVLNLPGTATPGRPRQSTVNGLPKGALNLSVDGINAQDPLLKSSDGFFTYIRPRIDAIEEVSVSTATPGAEAAAGGAIHINFVTKGGTNEYHGGVFWYHRNPVLNSNFYFNTTNRIKDPKNPDCDPATPGCLVETPRARVLLNQIGGKVGGPIIKDRVFFFASYEEYRLPEQTVRTRSILSPEAQRGIFRYAGGPAGGVDLLALAGSRGFTSTFDPLMSKILADIRTSTGVGSVVNTADPNIQSFTFTNTGGQTRRFPTLRVDANVTDKHHVEAIYNYQDFASVVDFLNGVDPAFPSPVPQIFGSQGSDRFSLTTALRSQLTATIVNEARFGLVGGTVVFFPEVAEASFDPFGGIAPVFPLTSNPFSTTNPQRRNSPYQQFNDDLSWVKGRHNMRFGMSYSHVSLFSQNVAGRVVSQVTFGLNTSNPASSIFNSTTLPGSNATIQGRARSLYAQLTGTILNVNDQGRLNEDTKEYSLDDTAISRNDRTEYGFYGQDSFKVRPNLTLNFGLRWQPVLSPHHNNEVYIRPGFEGLYGISGVGNLFKPGVTPGTPTEYQPVLKDDKVFRDDFNNFAPSIGLAWSPHFKNSWLKKIFGEGDQSVFRAAYSISYFTGGTNEFDGILATNPGLTTFAGLRSGIETPAASPLLLRNPIPAIPVPPAPVFPRAAVAGTSAADFDPNLETPYVSSWSFGIQRELNRDTVLEVRYVANHGTKLIRTLNLNEVNIFENGFLQEFIAAQNNLAIALAAGRAANFRNQGLPGQVNLPIYAASFGSPTSTLFGNATFINHLIQGTAGAAASLLGASSANAVFQTNRIAAGLPANLFTVNPSVYGAGSFVQTNGADSTYNSLQIELRRRLAQGLLVQGSYVFSKSITNSFASSSVSQAEPTTLRNFGENKGPSPFDIRHAFKVNYIYELPIGPGKRFLSGGGVLGKILEGWGTDGIGRWQGGGVQLLTCGRATFNNKESGCVLVGMSARDLQDAIKIRKDPTASDPNSPFAGNVLWLPEDIRINTLRAFGLEPGTPTGRYIAPPTTPGVLGNQIYVYGPSFFRADLSILKRTRVTETVNVEFRAEFLNAFNNTNFLIRSPAADVGTIAVNSVDFGQTGQAYQDTSTTNDPGGRLIQFVLRINF
jgi:hypothetical protein